MAEEGYAFGRVTDLVDSPEDVLPLAQELADRVASLSPLGVQGTKAALNRLLGQRAGEVLELSLQLEGMTRHHAMSSKPQPPSSRNILAAMQAHES